MKQALRVEDFRMNRIRIYQGAEPALPETEDLCRAFLDGGCQSAFGMETTVCGVMPDGRRVTAVKHFDGWRIDGPAAPTSPTLATSPADLLELSSGLRAARSTVHPQTAA